MNSVWLHWMFVNIFFCQRNKKLNHKLVCIFGYNCRFCCSQIKTVRILNKQTHTHEIKEKKSSINHQHYACTIRQQNGRSKVNKWKQAFCILNMFHRHMHACQCSYFTNTINQVTLYDSSKWITRKTILMKEQTMKWIDSLHRAWFVVVTNRHAT